MSDDEEVQFSLVGHKVHQVLLEEFATETCGKVFGGGKEDMMWHVEKFGAKEARNKFGVDGTGVRVAVIDTGVHMNHSKLVGKVIAHDCTGEGPADLDGHGTHCCGIVHDVAPGAEIHSFRVFDTKNRAVDRNIMRALNDICDEKYGKFDVISMSLGGGMPMHSMGMMLLRLNARGIFICCASGNEGDHNSMTAPRFGTVNWPAHFNSTLAIGSVDKRKQRSKFSSSGPEITVMAPGEQVWSCWKDGGMACLSGTSMATPFVAGTLALMLQACKKNGITRPTLCQLLYSIAFSCCDLEEPGFDFFTGYGLINPVGLIERYMSLSDELSKLAK